MGFGASHFKNCSLSFANLSRNCSRHFFRQNWCRYHVRRMSPNLVVPQLAQRRFSFIRPRKLIRAVTATFGWRVCSEAYKFDKGWATENAECAGRVQHPLTGREMRALRRLQREAPTSPFMFVSERGAPFTTAGFARMIERAATSAKLDIKVHPHMLRHACGYALANKGYDTRGLQAYLGHRYIQHTVRYTELSSDRFKGWWKD
jgi:integrase